MYSPSGHVRQLWRYGLAACLWIGANVVALAWIEIYESRKLEKEFGVPAGVIRAYESRTIDVVLDGGRRLSLWYRFRPPPRFGGPRTVPLVVFLHGAGQRGSDNVRQLRSLPVVLCESSMQTRYPCAVLAPQCPPGWHWTTPLEGDIDLLEGVCRMIDEVLADSRIDPNRVYLAGLSMGGFGTWELAIRFPERFAAVIPVCGGGDEARAGALVRVPVWAVHGAADRVVPVTASRDMIAALRTAGGEPRYLELPDVGHNCWDTAFHEDSAILAWMFRQVRRPATKSVLLSEDES